MEEKPSDSAYHNQWHSWEIALSVCEWYLQGKNIKECVDIKLACFGVISWSNIHKHRLGQEGSDNEIILATENRVI